MRILYLTKLMDVGGIETNLVRLSRALRSLGHDVTVVSSGGSLVPDLEAAGAEHITLPMSLRPFALTRSAINLRRLLRGRRFDVAHAMAASANLVLQVGGPARTLAVSSPMGLQNSEREFDLITRLRNRLIAAGRRYVLVISDEIEQELLRAGIRSDRLIRADLVGIEVAEFTVPQDAIDRVRADLGIRPGERVITTIGNLHPRKSHDLFLEAASVIGRRRPELRFVIVGDGPERDRLVRRAADLGLARRTVFAGQRRDVPAVLAASDVYVKPGIVEGFIGITVLEAMAARVPVVAFDTRDVRRAIEAEGSGLIVPSRNTEAMADAWGRLLDDEGLVDRLTTAAHATVRARFATVSIARNLVDLYATLVAGPAWYKARP